MPRRTTTDNTQPARSSQASTKANDSDETSYAIISAETWDISQLSSGPAKANKSGQGKSAPFLLNKKKFYLKVPKMTSPFGASFPKAQPGKPMLIENPKCSLQMTLGDDASNQAFQAKIEEFDEWMINEACKPENQLTWLNASKTKLFSREVVESKYSRMIKYSMKDGERQAQYPPFVRANFTTMYNEPTQLSTEVYDRDNKPMTVSMDPNSPNYICKKIPSFSSVSGLLSGSIWANATNFGVTWSFAQIKAFPAKGLTKGKCLLGDPEDEKPEASEDEADATTTQADPETEAEVVASGDAETTSDGDDVTEVVEENEEELGGEAPVETPAPVAVAKPKVATAAAPAPKARVQTKPKA